MTCMIIFRLFTFLFFCFLINQKIVAQENQLNQVSDFGIGFFAGGQYFNPEGINSILEEEDVPTINSNLFNFGFIMDFHANRHMVTFQFNYGFGNFEETVDVKMRSYGIGGGILYGYEFFVWKVLLVPQTGITVDGLYIIAKDNTNSNSSLNQQITNRDISELQYREGSIPIILKAFLPNDYVEPIQLGMYVSYQIPFRQFWINSDAGPTFNLGGFKIGMILKFLTNNRLR